MAPPRYSEQEWRQLEALSQTLDRAVEQVSWFRRKYTEQREKSTDRALLREVMFDNVYPTFCRDSVQEALKLSERWGLLIGREDLLLRPGNAGGLTGTISALEDARWRVQGLLGDARRERVSVY